MTCVEQDNRGASLRLNARFGIYTRGRQHFAAGSSRRDEVRRVLGTPLWQALASASYALSTIVAHRESTWRTRMPTQLTKSQLIEKISVETEIAKKDVKGVLETLVTVGHKEHKKTGVFLVPGFAKFVVVKKPATKARKGVNPFNGEEMMFKAKPARKIVRARPVKAAKDAV